MSKLKKINIGVLLFYIIFFCFCITAQQLFGDEQILNKKLTTFDISKNINKEVIKIAVILSYNPTHPCGKLQQLGLLQKLKQYQQNNNVIFNIECYYMETNSINITRCKKLEQVKYVNRFISKEVKPKFIITIDDAAFKYVGAPLSKKGYIVFFSGLNNPLIYYKNLYNPKNVSGIQEIVSFNKLKKFLSKNILLENNIKVLFSKTPSITEMAILRNIILKFNLLNIKYKIIYINNKNNLISYLKKNNNKHITYEVTLQRLYDSYHKKFIGKQEIYKLFQRYNTKNIEIVGNSYGVVHYKLAISNGSNFRKMGYDVGNLVCMYIQNQFQLKNNIVDNSDTIISVNYEKFKKLDLDNLIINNFKLIHDIY